MPATEKLKTTVDGTPATKKLKTLTVRQRTTTPIRLQLGMLLKLGEQVAEFRAEPENKLCGGRKEGHGRQK